MRVTIDKVAKEKLMKRVYDAMSVVMEPSQKFEL